MSLPTDSDERKGIPIYSGFICYFPHAVAAVAQLSRIGNDQHNPGQPLHWAKEKSSDELDALLRHVTDMSIDEEHRDPDGVLAAVKAFWRAGANLERMHDRGINIFATEEEKNGTTRDDRGDEAADEGSAAFEQLTVSYHRGNNFRGCFDPYPLPVSLTWAE